MFKFVVLSAVFAIAAAKPSGFEYTAPAAVSHQFRTDVISKPLIATYTAPIVKKVIATPIVKKVVAAPIVHKVVAAPLTYSAAVTHQSRVDFHHPTVAVAPVAYAHHAPLTYAAHHVPLTYSAPYAAAEHSW